MTEQAQKEGTLAVEIDMYLRSAASKGYYAFFHYARYYAKKVYQPVVGNPESKRYVQPEGQGSHASLVAWYKREFTFNQDPRFLAIQMALGSAKNIREVVDYEESFQVRGKNYGNAQKCYLDIRDLVSPMLADLTELINEAH